MLIAATARTARSTCSDGWGPTTTKGARPCAAWPRYPPLGPVVVNEQPDPDAQQTHRPRLLVHCQLGRVARGSAQWALRRRTSRRASQSSPCAARAAPSPTPRPASSATRQISAHTHAWSEPRTPIPFAARCSRHVEGIKVPMVPSSLLGFLPVRAG